MYEDKKRGNIYCEYFGLLLKGVRDCSYSRYLQINENQLLPTQPTEDRIISWNW